jgi:hypothetical protein
MKMNKKKVFFSNFVKKINGITKNAQRNDPGTTTDPLQNDELFRVHKRATRRTPGARHVSSRLVRVHQGVWKRDPTERFGKSQKQNTSDASASVVSIG